MSPRSLPTQFHRRIEQDGFAIANDVFSDSAIDQLRQTVLEIPEGEEVRRKTSVYGIRNLLELSPGIRSLAAFSTIRTLIEPVLGTDCFAVRATFFDKVPGANWNLQFHQDCTISVRRKIETEGFGPWSEKAGVMQVQPPDAVLSQMLAVRVHLDPCLEENGALRVLVGSHSQRWDQEELSECRTRFKEAICEVSIGGVLFMRPLLLHASSASMSPGHRRVIHIEYASQSLPNGLEWNNRIVPEQSD